MIARSRQVALVLGSGGARGLAHIGVLKSLEENNIPIDNVVGTSIGALIGGLYASGIGVKSMEKIVSELDKIMVAKILIPKLFSPGVIDNKKVFDFIKDLVGETKIENLNIPFASIATDLVTGEEVVFKKGLLIEAILASIAIPTLFQPVWINDRYLIDGGLSNPLPISIAAETKADIIIAVNVSPNPQRITRKIKTKRTEEVKQLFKKLPKMFSNMLAENKIVTPESESNIKIIDQLETQPYSPTLMNVFLQSISISTNNLITQHLRYAKPNILLSPRIEEFDMLEFYKGTEIMKCGYDSAQKAIHEIKTLL